MVVWLLVVVLAGAGVAVANKRYGHAAIIVVLGATGGAASYGLASRTDSLLWLVPLVLFTGIAGWLTADAVRAQVRWGRVVLGGLVGAVPGVLLMVVPVLLHTTDVITADQSQIGFIGMPVALFGLFAGALAGGLSGRTPPPVDQGGERRPEVPTP